MLLLVFLNLFYFDQGKVNQALEYMESLQVSSPLQINPGLRVCRSQLNPEIELRDDIIIGDVPGETLMVVGPFYNYGNIYIINDGVLIVKNSDFDLDGDIILTNQGKALIDSSNLRFLQHFIYHHAIMLWDSSYFSITNSQTSFNGYPFNVGVNDSSMMIMEAVRNADWITAVVTGAGSADLYDVRITGEWLFMNRCDARFNRVENLLTWYFFEDSSVVDFAFPQADTIYGFYFDSTLNNVSGVGYHIEIDSSSMCMWATIPLRGSDVIIRDSHLRVTGLMFNGVDTFFISGLVNGLFYPDYILPIGDRTYHLINSSVDTWNLYPSDSTNVTLTSSIFGELCGFGNSYTVIQNAFCDGTGGHIEASSNAVVLVFLSSVFADIITKDHGMCLLGFTSVVWGNIWVTGSSVMIIVNSQFPEAPIPSDTSLVFVAGISGPSNAGIDDTVGIFGSAWIDRGPYQPLDFDYYQLFYHLAGDSFWYPVGGPRYTEVRYDTLDYWNTVGLTPATYELRLVLKDTAGDSVEALKQIVLRPTGVSEESQNFADGFRIIRTGPRQFYINSSESSFTYDIYDLLGRRMARLKGNSFWNAPAGGCYFIRKVGDRGFKKVVAY